MKASLSCACVAACLALGACDRTTTDNAEASAKRAGAKIEQGLDRAGAKIKDAAEKTGDKISGATTHITTGEKTSATVSGISEDTKAKLSDSAITASIKANFLADPDLHVLKIDVDTAQGVVALNGVVKDDAAKQRAQHLAAGVKGVREVRNHLSVKQG